MTPTPRQIVTHIERFTRSPGCPFCRAHARVSRSEVREFIEKLRRREGRLT